MALDLKPRHAFAPSFLRKIAMLTPIRLGCLFLLSLALTPVASAQTAREQLFPDGEFFTFDGRAAFILRPKPTAEKTTTPQPWVFYAPTLPAYPDKHEEWMHRQFLTAGIAIAGIDVGEAYGEPESRKVFDRFYEELTEHRNFAKKPCLLGRSRGGLWVSSWACDHPQRFAGLAGIYPVFDFRTYPGINKAAKAYGLTAGQLEEQLSQHNPIARIDAIAKAKLPVFIVHGDQDKVVPLEANSASVAARYRALGAADVLELKVCPGQGHNFWEGFFRCQELIDFVIKQARSH